MGDKKFGSPHKIFVYKVGFSSSVDTITAIRHHLCVCLLYQLKDNKLGGEDKLLTFSLYS